MAESGGELAGSQSPPELATFESSSSDESDFLVIAEDDQEVADAAARRPQEDGTSEVLASQPASLMASTHTETGEEPRDSPGGAEARLNPAVTSSHQVAGSHQRNVETDSKLLPQNLAKSSEGSLEGETSSSEDLPSDLLTGKKKKVRRKTKNKNKNKPSRKEAEKAGQTEKWPSLPKTAELLETASPGSDVSPIPARQKHQPDPPTVRGPPRSPPQKKQ